MKVICAGFPKTGTKTMYAALRELGYSVYDFDENFWFLRRDWMKILSGQSEDPELWREMYSDVDAVTDLPASFFWREIHRAFPDAKIVLTLREDSSTWLDSMNHQIQVLENNFIFRLMCFVCPTAIWMRFMVNAIGKVVFNSAPIWPWQWNYVRRSNGVRMKEVYDKHNENVLQFAPKDKLLVFRCQEGWSPLCKFLNKPIPDKPFPHKNIRGGVVAEKLLENSPLICRLQLEFKVAIATVLIPVVYLFFRNFWLK
ncbi:uncharacterized protein LOC100184759 [Ciona intestinalis]